MANKIWLSSPHMGGMEQQYVKEAFETNWIAPLGPHVDGFENDIENFLGNDIRAAALSSGTAAIHLALILLGVEAGDIVLCQSMTFAASANPVVYLGAKPVFIDSEEETWNMSPLFLEQAIKACLNNGKKPKAIIVVHLYGMPANLEEIISIAKNYNIPVIEDAAEALGSSINGQKCGTFGDIGILSFNGNKIITTSGGGAIVSKNIEWVEKARFLSTQARDIAPHFEHTQIGYNYRMSNICAAIGRGQMRVIEERIRQRRNNYTFYKDSLSGFAGLLFLPEPAGYFSNRWLTTLLIDPLKTPNNNTREQVRLALAEENIEARPLWKPMHLQPVFAESLYFGSNISKRLFDLGLCLPSGSNLTQEDLHAVLTNISALFA